MSETEKRDLKKDVILFSLLYTKFFLSEDVVKSPDVNPEDLSLAKDMLFFIDWILKEDYPDKAEKISKPNWGELKNC